MLMVARASRSIAFSLGASVVLLCGCETIEDIFGDAKEAADDAVSSEVRGRVQDNRGQPVAGARVRLYDLLDNTHFVEGSDLGSAEAYIDREAVLGSDNDVASARTGDDGRFLIDDVTPSAFLAVASHPTCSPGFAGFEEETGILNLDTLITPELDDGLNFTIPTFVVACATPPEVGADGNSDQAPAFEPEAPPAPTCDAASCEAAGGSCDGAACVIACAEQRCAESGGTCMAGQCVLPACGAECVAQGGVCSADGSVCELPACSADADCQAAQPGAYCSNPGDVARASCEPPLPAEIVPPVEAVGWSSLRVTDAADNVLADASADNQRIDSAALPSDGLLRIHAEYTGAATTAYIQVQSGGQSCPNLPPRTDFIAVELEQGRLTTSQGAFAELVAHGGYQKIQLSTSAVLGEGERSFGVEVGEPCAPPAHPFVAMLSWEAGPGAPADLDLNVWNGAGELVCVGQKQAAWGRLAHEGKGPGPEVFEASDSAQGPFTIKVQFFSGRPRELQGKLRVIRSVDGQVRDDSYVFVVRRPKDVAEIGVFAAD